MLSNKNNLRSELTANVWVLDTTISITSWEWVLWENNMVACLEHYESGVCTKREVIKITAKSTDTFTITRWFADCIMNDNTKAQGHGSQTFSVGDYLSLYLSKEIWESLTTWITTNETDIQTMVARINAPRTCIENNCQTRKNCIDDAYVTKFGGNAGFWTGADGDCVITSDTFLCANREYNFNNLTICEWATVRFCGIWTPTINVWNDFVNCGVLDMRAPYLQARTCKQTDCWLHKWTEVCNQCESLSWIASEWWLYCGGAWWCGASSWCGASDWHGGNGGSGGLYDWCNGWDGWTSGCLWTGGWWGFGVWKGWNGGAWTCNGGNGWNWYYWWQWWDKTWNVSSWWWWAGGVWVVRWWDAGWWRWSLDYTTMWNGGDAITNVYWLHLNARNIYNKCVNSRWWDGWNGWLYCWTWTSWWDTPSGWNGGNGANGWQILVSYDCMYEQWCFDVSGWKGWEGGKIKFTSESYWRYEQPNGTDWTAGWVVFRDLNNPYIQNFNLENDEDNEAILISWKDPSFKPWNPQQRAKTVVRYSTTNYPTTPTDWTLAVEETTKDQYETNPYSLTGVLDETTYYFTAFAIDQNNNIIDTQTLSITTDFWWHVTPNTLLYLPLDGDLIDKSSHQNNWTAIWTISFQTIWSKRYAYFNANSAIQLSSIPVWTWNPSAFTQSAWLKTNSNWLWCMHHFGNDSYHARSCLIVFYMDDKKPLQDLYWSWWDTYLWPASNSSLWNTWIYVGYTYNNGTHKLYINWQLYGTWSNAINISWTNNKNVWRVDWTWWYAMADCIFESGERSAQNFLDYYNKTKKKFGYT